MRQLTIWLDEEDIATLVAMAEELRIKPLSYARSLLARKLREELLKTERSRGARGT